MGALIDNPFAAALWPGILHRLGGVAWLVGVGQRREVAHRACAGKDGDRASPGLTVPSIEKAAGESAGGVAGLAGSAGTPGEAPLPTGISPRDPLTAQRESIRCAHATGLDATGRHRGARVASAIMGSRPHLWPKHQD